jgi:hypothetical protein
MPQFTLSKIKTFNGMEGHGLNAVVMMDSIPIAFVLDDASGGEVQIDFANPLQNPASYKKTMADKPLMESRRKAFEEFCAKWYVESGTEARDREQWEEWNKQGGGAHPFKRDAHGMMVTWINHTVDEIANKRRFDRLAKNKTLFRVDGDAEGAWRTLKAPYSPAVQKFLDQKYGAKVSAIYGVKEAA